MTQSQIPPALAAFLSSDLPEPLKAAAGIAVSAVEDVRDFPNRITNLPTSVLSNLAAKSFKVQQQYAEWVAKGEDFLSSLQPPSDEPPPWATFDEDIVPPPGPGRPSAGENGVPPRVDNPDVAPLADVAPSPSAPAAAKKSAPTKKSAPAKKAPAQKSAPAKKSAPATKKSPATKPSTVPTSAPSQQSAAPIAGALPETAAARKVAAQRVRANGPAPLPDLDTLTIPQLRARLKTLRLDELRTLVDYEQAHQARTPILALLQGRVDVLTT